MIGISSCLGGICCRYDGKSQEQEALKQLVTNGKAIMICPEVLGRVAYSTSASRNHWRGWL